MISGCTAPPAPPASPPSPPRPRRRAPAVPGSCAWGRAGCGCPHSPPPAPGRGDPDAVHASPPSCAASWSGGASARKKWVSKRFGRSAGVIQWPKGSMACGMGARRSSSSTVVKSFSPAESAWRCAASIGSRRSAVTRRPRRHAPAARRIPRRSRGCRRCGSAHCDVRGDAGGDRLVVLLHPAARKDEGAGGEFDLVVAHHHEDLRPGLAVAQQQDGRGGAGGGGLVGARNVGAHPRCGCRPAGPGGPRPAPGPIRCGCRRRGSPASSDRIPP